MLCGLEAFEFTLVTMVSGKNLSNQCCWIGIAYIIQNFLSHTISLKPLSKAYNFYTLNY